MIEIYCDESRQDLLVSRKPEYTYTLIGSLWMTKAIRLELSGQIKTLREQYKRLGGDKVE